jgi:pimeloyl-ACP methyl ester carboxylesterase
VPTVILWGERDAALGAELAEQSTAWLDSGSLVRFPNATHWVHEDLPEEITRELLAHFGADGR